MTSHCGASASGGVTAGATVVAPPAEPTEQTQEGQEGQQAEQTEQAPQPQLCRSGHTRALVTPRADTQRRGSRPPPRP